MFERLDDLDGFEAGEAFFAGTSRRFTRRRRKLAAVRAASGVLCFAVAAPAFFGAYEWHGVDDTGQRDVPTGESHTVDSVPFDGSTSPDPGPLDTFPVAVPNATNFLIVGLDNNGCVDAGSPYAKAFGAAPDSGVRADTIMVLRLDPSTNEASVLSIPRDLWIAIPGGGSRRINSTYTLDDPQMLIDMLLSEFQIPVDHFVQFDFCAFTKLVDAVGGVTVPMPYAVRDEHTGLYVPQPGCTSFTGDEALAYVRSRHLQYMDGATGVWHEDPSSDIGRISRQQDFLTRSFASASSSGVLTPKVISALYAAYRDDVVVDTGLTIAKLIEFVGAIRSVNPADIRGYQIEATGATIAGSAVLIWNKDSLAMNAILDIFRGVATPADTPAVSPTASSPASSIPRSAVVPDPTIEC